MNKLETNKLLISEDFYSVQAEGITSGVPSYFVRLANCNLSCGANMSLVNKIKKGEINPGPGEFKGDLHEQGKATWTCDTIPVWVKGTERDFDYLIDKWIIEGIEKDIRSGLIHVVWTGGEPTIPSHQEAIAKFIEYYYFKATKIWDALPDTFQPFFEIETNGTIYINTELIGLISQINCSPKLSNSGMSKDKRIIPNAIQRIQDHLNYQFKFVISSEDDVKEIFEDFITPFNIPLDKVVCMPGLDDQKDFFERTRFVLEMAKKYKFIGLTRLHVAAWDKLTGV